MSEIQFDRRIARRSETNISAVVRGRESEAFFWTENTELETVSKVGAGFNLEHELNVGRVISIICKMPKWLRSYDQDKEMYRVWGLVQHCTPITTDAGSRFQIGVAFIGKHAPKSYSSDPLRTYRVSGMDKDGFWSVGEAKTAFVSRSHFRFPVALPCKLTLINPEGAEIGFDNDAVSENLSVGGASIYTHLELTTGEAVKIQFTDPEFITIALVRNRQLRSHDKATLHLHFTDAEFPVKLLDVSPHTLAVEAAENSPQNEHDNEPSFAESPAVMEDPSHLLTEGGDTVPDRDDYVSESEQDDSAPDLDLETEEEVLSAIDSEMEHEEALLDV
ncbi:MAG: PilZ domain-containing protein [Pyrinomonadaceae bacterium]